jgi:preprotein translocase subunit YajC
VNLLTFSLPLAQAAQQPAAPEATNVEQKTSTPGAAAPTTQPKDAPPGWMTFMPWILIAVVFYFFLLRPKNKQEKQRVAMLSSLKKGDRIQTIGGILGTVVESRDDEVVVKVDETSNTKITFSRSAIHRVREEEKK